MSCTLALLVALVSTSTSQATTLNPAPSPVRRLQASSCTQMTDLSSLSSPYFGSTNSSPNSFLPSCIGDGGGGNENIFSIEVPSGWIISIGMTSNTFDSVHETRWGGTCPGSNIVQCTDDPDTSRHSWTNFQGSTQPVYFTIDQYTLFDSGNFELTWTLQQCAVCRTTAFCFYAASCGSSYGSASNTYAACGWYFSSYSSANCGSLPSCPSSGCQIQATSLDSPPGISSANLQQCQGDCDVDADCVGNLLCFQRSGTESVPGCSGSGDSGWDYCIQASTTSTTIRASTTSTTMMLAIEDDMVIVIIVAAACMVCCCCCGGVMLIYIRGHCRSRSRSVMVFPIVPDPDPTHFAGVHVALPDPVQAALNEKFPKHAWVVQEDDVWKNPDWTNADTPPCWTHHDAPSWLQFDMMLCVPPSFAEHFQDVLQESYIAKVSQDRLCPSNVHGRTPGGCPCVQPGGVPGLPTKFAVLRVVHNEDSKMWKRYCDKRAHIKDRRSGDSIRQFDPALLTAQFAERYSKDLGILDSEINECFLWHGTSVRAALKIAQNDYRLDLAGSSTGTMYGNGIYLAESCTKSDEYAKCDNPGGYYDDVFAMLLCRVCMGRLYYTTKRDPTAGDRITDGSHDSTCGDRSAVANTFREFVVYDTDQIYPEYILFYSRIYAGDTEERSRKFQLQLPIYWKNCDKDPRQEAFDERVRVRPATKNFIGQLASRCSGAMAELVDAWRIEDSKMFNEYMDFKTSLLSRRKTIVFVDSIETVATKVTEVIKQLPDQESEISTENLDHDINEFFLWHGTARPNAHNIAETGFIQGDTGRFQAARFGRGVYLAEDLDKSLSFAPKDEDGCQHILLCRALCGRMHHISHNGYQGAPHEEAQQKGMHSILAAPTIGSREFVLLTQQQVYPEFLLRIRVDA
eukprot:TRINITY_DN19198_c0_g2_i2.p1 TRINITY_DN19198_c0_g2~~TRINITY_DN19198_c0_g2_i2.p1  ORF type:complete len:911 (-),score=114.29 TRINITY_DN19198_c0_g2_i2:7-2739(-)